MSAKRTDLQARRAFTLIEILLALVIASVVLSLGYGALAAASDLGARIANADDEFTSDARFRALLADALRHPAPSAEVDEAVFVVEQGTGGDRLAFASRGLVAPLGATGGWRVIVWPDSAGLHVEAHSSGATTRAPIRATLPGAHALEVLTSDRAEGTGWMRGWHRDSRAPAIVALRWRTDAGQATPLVVRTSLEDVR